MSDILNELTQEQIQELLSVSQRIREQDIRGVRTETDLPEEIQAELDETPPSELKQKSKLMPGTAIDTMEDAGLNPGQST